MASSCKIRAKANGALKLVVTTKLDALRAASGALCSWITAHALVTDTAACKLAIAG